MREKLEKMADQGPWAHQAQLILVYLSEGQHDVAMEYAAVVSLLEHEQGGGKLWPEIMRYISDQTAEMQAKSELAVLIESIDDDFFADLGLKAQVDRVLLARRLERAVNYPPTIRYRQVEKKVRDLVGMDPTRIHQLWSALPVNMRLRGFAYDAMRESVVEYLMLHAAKKLSQHAAPRDGRGDREV